MLEFKKKGKKRNVRDEKMKKCFDRKVRKKINLMLDAEK
jgi:hypothetical protein